MRPNPFQESDAMTARQQLARLLPLALLVVLVMAGLRGTVASPRWNGPLKADGAAIGLALEAVLGVLLVITVRREGAARRAARGRPYSAADDEISVPSALRFVLSWVLGAGMAVIAAVLLADLHLHFFSKPERQSRSAAPPLRLRPRPSASRGGETAFHIPLGPVLYGLLVLALVAAVAVSIWWSARLRRPAAPGRIEGDPGSEELREAVESGRAALASLSDARAAIIACYLAMERSLAERGTARGAADTPDELLTRAVAAGLVRGAAARRLTALFYEARFSSHPLGREQRDAASRALDELAAELSAGVPS
jgi:multisubunit Na+/H+ antiporter MnhB subunit